jgi:hypothetical protein
LDKETGKMTSAPLEKMAPFVSDELFEQCVYKVESSLFESVALQ